MQSPSSSHRDSKHLTVDSLFILHSALSALCGALAFLVPHLYGCFLIPHGEASCWTRVRDNSDPRDMEPHLVLRLYGSAQLAFAVISWSVRSLRDADARRNIIRAYFVMFLLALLSHLRAQTAGGSILSAYNWLNILQFAGLSAGFGYFSLFEPLTSFSSKGGFKI
jgi:hypothetical protein